MSIKLQVIIPAAGRGERAQGLTASRGVKHKEALTLIEDRPVLELVLEEILATGIPTTDIIVVINNQKDDLRNQIRSHDRFQGVRFVYQDPGTKGNAAPLKSLLSAHDEIDFTRPLLIMWADELLVPTQGSVSCLQQMHDQFRTCSQKESLVAIFRVDRDQVPQKGIVRLKEQAIAPDIYELEEIVEKPILAEAPRFPDQSIAQFATCSSIYLFQPDCWHYVQALQPGRDGELWLVDIINKMCSKNRVLAKFFRNATLLDVGNETAYQEALAFLGK